MSNTTASYVIITLSSHSRDEEIPQRKLSLDTDSAPRIEIGRSSKRNNGRGPPAVSNAIYSSPVISRKHAELFVRSNGGPVYIKDVNSLHGTTVNFESLAAGEERPLSPGDVITLGEVRNDPHNTLSRRFEIDYHWVENPQSAVRSTSVEIIENPYDDTIRDVLEPIVTVTKPSRLTAYQVPDLSSSESEHDNSRDGDIAGRIRSTVAASKRASLAKNFPSSDFSSDNNSNAAHMLSKDEPRLNEISNLPEYHTGNVNATESARYPSHHSGGQSSPIKSDNHIFIFEDNSSDGSSDSANRPGRHSIELKERASPRTSLSTLVGTESKPIQVDDDISDAKSEDRGTSSLHVSNIYEDECPNCGGEIDDACEIFECPMCGTLQHAACTAPADSQTNSEALCDMCNLDRTSLIEASAREGDSRLVADVQSTIESSKAMIAELNEKTAATVLTSKRTPTPEQNPTTTAAAEYVEAQPTFDVCHTQNPESPFGRSSHRYDTTYDVLDEPWEFNQSHHSTRPAYRDDSHKEPPASHTYHHVYDDPSFDPPYGRTAIAPPWHRKPIAPASADLFLIEGPNEFQQQFWTTPARSDGNEQFSHSQSSRLHRESPTNHEEELRKDNSNTARFLPSLKDAVNSLEPTDMAKTTLPGMVSLPNANVINPADMEVLSPPTSPAMHSASRVAIESLVTPSPSTPYSRKSAPVQEQVTVEIGNKRKLDQISDSPSSLGASDNESQSPSATQQPGKKLKAVATASTTIESPKPEAASSGISASGFILGALAGGIGVLGALVALPESMF